MLDARSSAPGVLWLDGAAVVEREPALDAPLAAAEAAVRMRLARRRRSPPSGRCTSASGSIPTKTRPSSEALLRRVRKGDTLPRINSMVDVCNWCSLEFQLPYGLYDAAHIDGDVVLRLGAAGRVVRRASAKTTSTSRDASRWPIDIGPFGNPTSDSARTMVTTATTRALVVVFAPREVEQRRLTQVLDVTSARMAEFTGCAETARSIV